MLQVRLKFAPQLDYTDSATENFGLLDRRCSGSSGQMGGEGKGNDSFFHSDSKHCRKIGSNSSSSSRETYSERLGRVNPLNDVSFRKSTRERTD